MKFTLSWLKDHLATDASLDDIVEIMVAVGLEVEDVENPEERLSAFTIGEVIEAEQHPDADKLKVCRVATKDGEMQIVCGAPNARAGIKVAYAPVGAYVPGIDVTLSKAKIRGVESHGMMCSVRELEMGDDHDGIIEAPASAQVGDPVASVMGVNDPVIDFEVTPNRPDTNGVNGVARDLAAAKIGDFISPDPKPIKGDYPSPQKVELDFPEGSENACPVFAGRYVRGVKNGPSPKWLQDRLRAIGLRPISALVDITNYMSYDRARPLHVFDADKLQGVIRARLGKKGEKLLALDGKEYEIDETMTVIADDSGVLGLGGVMGGEDTGCTEETTNVFIECAYFDPLRTAKTGRKTGINSDARYRFERGVDPDFILPGMEMATQLVMDMCGGEPSEVELAGAVPQTDNTVLFPPAEVKRLTGMDVAPEKAEEILEALGFTVRKSDPWQVDVPSWRPDIEGKADLVEEVARIVGFDHLPTETLPALKPVETPKLTPGQDRRRMARRVLAARGMLEAVTWSFLDEKHAELFMSAEEIKAKGLVLANPIASDLGVMRSSLLPNLISALQRNADRGRDDLALFEVAPIYAGDQPADHQNAAGGARLSHPTRHWQGARATADVFTVKADAIAALEAAGAPVASLQTSADAPDYFHPGRSGVLRLGPKALAHFGEIHPRVLKAMDVDGPVHGFEVFLDQIPASKKKPTKTRAALDASEFLPLTRDFAFVVEEGVTAETLLKAVRGAEKKLIADVSLFDVYQGKGVPEGMKSLAVEVTLQPREKTLTDEEIEAVSARIVAQVEKATGGTLRG
ncbi:phenylalanine--tRNA ligase subunit beta [Hyphococcus luteus]|uniref:Phenylalanine--tRNA ligase beta subunit n=1 Tax=Hyphococcus luteus TaxID=2058213 RepID=A0A2S7K623_9PROT|nr:phenylalanine--tRNA ligase subunit beta [Marinicaulis flavus]PQA87964.1 phenylalanine--tRNA ligase subunit beta [Marinicaulis flavus]